MSLIEKSLWKLASDIEPTQSQKQAAARSQNFLRAVLRTGNMQARIVTDYLSGSYARETAIRPLDDVDIVFVIDPSAWSRQIFARHPAPDTVLATFSRAIRYRYRESSLRTQRRSIGLKLYHLDIDVVPAIASSVDSDVILVADRESATWIASSPKRHEIFASQVNKKNDGRFKPLVKLLKFWNGRQPANARLKSFVIETMAARMFSSVPIQTLEGGMLDFWDFLSSFSDVRPRRTWPDRFGMSFGWWNTSVPDTAGINGNLLADIDYDRVVKFLNRAVMARDRLEQAQSAKTLEIAQKHFGRIF